MTEAEWLAGRVRKMLQYAQSKATMRQRRLIACGFCRIHWSQLPDDRLKQFVELIERYADGNTGGNTLVRAYELFGMAKKLAVANALEADLFKALRAAQASHEDPPATAFPQWQDSNLQVALLHDVFGNPFRPPPPVPPAVLAWNDASVRRLAEGIYKDRGFDRLPILADALEEAGCANSDILSHCRGPGPHIRGCWVVDLLTERGGR
jgi:hypothetical protein